MSTTVIQLRLDFFSSKTDSSCLPCISLEVGEIKSTQTAGGWVLPGSLSSDLFFESLLGPLQSWTAGARGDDSGDLCWEQEVVKASFPSLWPQGDWA